MAHKFRRDGNVLYCEQCGDTKKIDEERPCPFSVASFERPAKQARLEQTKNQENRKEQRKRTIQTRQHPEVVVVVAMDKLAMVSPHRGEQEHPRQTQP